MSGSGGYAQYRCKYFSTYGCDKWDLVMKTACPYCVAQGRDDNPVPVEPSQVGTIPSLPVAELRLPLAGQGSRFCGTENLSLVPGIPVW
ncbi:hypothetical protein GE09DRAFT_1159307 [Coniochaeta sp. 2T2.1]|nr:hypothetical protein GE09DRAFT_1159307 [Coniochaeta sp. 2T2.1]